MEEFEAAPPVELSHLPVARGLLVQGHVPSFVIAQSLDAPVVFGNFLTTSLVESMCLGSAEWNYAHVRVWTEVAQRQWIAGGFPENCWIVNSPTACLKTHAQEDMRLLRILFRLIDPGLKCFAFPVVTRFVFSDFGFYPTIELCVRWFLGFSCPLLCYPFCRFDRTLEVGF